MSAGVSRCAVGTAPARKLALVVDDVEDMLDLLEIALDAANFSVLRASSAREAAGLFEERGQEIDLLLTDIRVGAESGLELAKHLMTRKPTLHVLAMSGFAIDGKVVNGKSSFQFLPKPFSTSDLKKKLLAIFPPEPVRLAVRVSSDSNGNYTVTTNCIATSAQRLS